MFAFWSQVGGQGHLDMMFWGWKFGLGLLSAGLITGIAAEVTREEGPRLRRLLTLWTLLLASAIAAGVVTYYYHTNEPADDEQDTTQTYQT